MRREQWSKCSSRKVLSFTPDFLRETQCEVKALSKRGTQAVTSALNFSLAFVLAVKCIHSSISSSWFRSLATFGSDMTLTMPIHSVWLKGAAVRRKRVRKRLVRVAGLSSCILAKAVKSSSDTSSSFFSGSSFAVNGEWAVYSPMREVQYFEPSLLPLPATFMSRRTRSRSSRPSTCLCSTIALGTNLQCFEIALFTFSSVPRLSSRLVARLSLSRASGEAAGASLGFFSLAFAPASSAIAQARRLPPHL